MDTRDSSTRRAALKDARSLLMAARDGGGDKAVLYAVWNHLSAEYYGECE